MKIYEEETDREIVHGDNLYDTFYLTIRVFRLEDGDLGIPVYVHEYEYRSYVGEPGSDRARTRWSHKTYLGGPDSKHIRRAIAVLDGFEAPKT